MCIPNLSLSSGCSLSGNPIGDVGARDIAEWLRVDDSLQQLESVFGAVLYVFSSIALIFLMLLHCSLSACSVGTDGATMLLDALRANTALTSLE